ncbi:MAG TPA: hypothetical protein VFV38_13615 [Ktedonobacteraceae bacterium]|nr:hypothetical protein [Ktedonobacteraceae bacterium]
MKPLVGFDWPGRPVQTRYIYQPESSCARISCLDWQNVAAHHSHPAGWHPEGLHPVSRWLLLARWKNQTVAYLGPAGHLHEHCGAGGGAWQHTNLSALTGAPPTPDFR